MSEKTKLGGEKDRNGKTKGTVCLPRYENYVFDLYGTLIDIRTDEEDMWAWKRMALFYRYQGAEYKAKELKKAYEKSVKQALKEAGDLEDSRGGSMENPEADRRGQDAGEPEDTAEIRIEKVFRKLYEDKGILPEEQLVAETCRIFRIVTTRKLKLFPGVKKGLRRLRQEGVRLYILSNAQRAFTESELRIFGLEKYFDGIVLSSDVGVKKPDRRIFDHLIETYRLDPARTLMTGDDRRCDIEGAGKAGMDSCLVGQGKHSVSHRKKSKHL